MQARPGKNRARGRAAGAGDRTALAACAASSSRSTLASSSRATARRSRITAKRLNRISSPVYLRGTETVGGTVSVNTQVSGRLFSPPLPPRAKRTGSCAAGSRAARRRPSRLLGSGLCARQGRTHAVNERTRTPLYRCGAYQEQRGRMRGRRARRRCRQRGRS